MNLLHRYIIRELIWPIILSVLFFSFLMMLRQLFGFAELLLEAGIGFKELMIFIGIIAVTLIIVTVPMAALLGCLIGVGRMTSENEILAMRVAGLSLPRLFAPVFIIALIGSLVLMYCGFTIIPTMGRSIRESQQRFAFEMFMRLESGRIYDDLETQSTKISLFFRDKLPPEAGDGPYTMRMGKVAMQVVGSGGDITGAKTGSESSDETRETLILSDSGMIEGDFENRSITLKLQDGRIFPLNFVETPNAEGGVTQYRRNPEREVSMQFGSMHQLISPEVESSLMRQDAHTMTMAELLAATRLEPTGPLYENARRKSLSGKWRDFLTARNELYQRITLPFSLLAFVLIGVPLAVELRPRAKTFSFLIAIGLLLVYYVMITTAGAVGMSNSPWTLVAYVAPDLVIGGIGVFLFWRVQR